MAHTIEMTTPTDTREDALSDLDHALQNWARRHGANPRVARAFALASHAVSQGHTCLSLDRIPTRLMRADHQTELAVALHGSELVGSPGDIRPLVLDGQRLYLQRYHDYEMKLAARLQTLMARPPEPVNIQRLIPGNGLFHGDPNQPEMTNWQAVAAFAALRHHFTVISGGPGTGKTYTIVRLLRVLIEPALQNNETPPLVALAAPTGKAASRMLESVRRGLDGMADDENFDAATFEQHIPQKAQTLHRLLGLYGNSTRARFRAANPLPHDVVIIDEASMVDLPMMTKLTEAIRDDARLILLGDRYQLASVESGSVLADICAHAGENQFTAAQQTAAGELLRSSGKPASHTLADHVVTLQTSRRFNAESPIGQLATAVNNGDTQMAQSLLSSGLDELNHQNRVDGPSLQQLVRRLADHYARLCEADNPHSALALLGEQCVLTALLHGPTGSETLNQGITEQLATRLGFNPADRWYHGRPVMIRQNDYRCGLFNGDIGIALEKTQGQMRVWFKADEGVKSFLPNALPAHDTVYAMTIHKSQGSEFNNVTLLLPGHDTPILSRELLYTGLTRARRQLTLFADSGILQRTIEQCTLRHSGLADRLETT